MPVKKFRSLAEAEQDLWLEPGDPRIWEGVCRRWALHRFLTSAKSESPHGVFKYRSIQEKQDHPRSGKDKISPCGRNDKKS